MSNTILQLVEQAQRCSRIAFSYNVLALAIRDVPEFRAEDAYTAYQAALDRIMQKIGSVSLTDEDVKEFGDVTEVTLSAYHDFLPTAFARRLQKDLTASHSQP